MYENDCQCGTCHTCGGDGYYYPYINGIAQKAKVRCPDCPGLADPTRGAFTK
jgi:TRAP-type uncharacterized transport system substrate-binding protein